MSTAPLAGAPGSLAQGYIRPADTGAVLAAVLAAAQVALFDAWEDRLELIAFQGPGPTPGAFGLTPPQITPGALWEESIYPSDRDNLHHFIQQTTSPHHLASTDYRLIVGEGELLWVRHWTLERTEGRGGRIRLRCMIMPVPEQKHLEWECLRVSERECNRIGQELHDDVCQVLAGLVFMMRVVGQRAQAIDADLAEELAELSTHVTQATERLRSMAHGLFPAQLNYTSLRDAVNAYAVEARTLFRITVSVQLPASLPPHSPEHIIHIYRILQEAVGNAVRHGGATEVKISLSRVRQRMQLRIENNGAGFPAASARPEGIGLHAMQYRARVLGGTLDLHSLSPHGVAVELSYPVHSSSPPSTQTEPTP